MSVLQRERLSAIETFSSRAMRIISLFVQGMCLQAVLFVTPALPLEDVIKGVVSRMSESCLPALALPILYCLPQV